MKVYPKPNRIGDYCDSNCTHTNSQSQKIADDLT